MARKATFVMSQEGSEGSRSHFEAGHGVNCLETASYRLSNGSLTRKIDLLGWFVEIHSLPQAKMRMAGLHDGLAIARSVKLKQLRGSLFHPETPAE
jgi:hypothetical protein